MGSASVRTEELIITNRKQVEMVEMVEMTDGSQQGELRVLLNYLACVVGMHMVKCVGVYTVVND